MGSRRITGAEDVALDRLERALAAISRTLAARHTLEDLAQRSGHRLPQASWSLLEFLDDLGPLRVSAIAECHGVDISTVTPRLQALQRAGLVERRTAVTDGRVSMIEISAGGRAALEALHAARRSLIAEGLDADDIALLTTTLGPLEQLASTLADARDEIGVHGTKVG